MKELFPGYYRPSQDEFTALWNDCVFVLDANVLLNLYRYPATARDELLNVITPLSNRLWVPFHAALEYQRNRPFVIARQNGRFNEVRKIVNDVIPNLEEEFRQLQLRDRHALIDPDRLIKPIKPVFQQFQDELKQLEKGQGRTNEEDELREKIDQILAGRVGAPPSEEDIRKINEEGEKRFENNVPPGFMDASKDDSEESTFSYGGIIYHRKFGDLILWKQIIEFAQANGIRSVMFLTDDEKKDWWWALDSKGRQKLGPRPELVDEIRREAEVEQFYIYSSEQFLNFSREYLSTDVSEESIEQVKEIASQPSRVSFRKHRQRAELAQKVVGEWILAHHLLAQIDMNKRDWPEMVVNLPDSEEPIGVDVCLVRDSRNVGMRVRDPLYRAYHHIRERGFAKFEVICVIDGDIDIPELNRLNRRKFDIPPGIRLTIGTLVSDGEAEYGFQFMPLIHRSAGDSSE